VNENGSVTKSEIGTIMSGIILAGTIVITPPAVNTMDITPMIQMDGPRCLTGEGVAVIINTIYNE